MRVSAAAELRGLAHEVRVRRRADADGEQARVAELLLDLREQRRLGADRAVGDENDLPQVAWRRRLRRARCRSQCRSPCRRRPRACRRTASARAWFCAVNGTGAVSRRSRRRIELNHVEPIAARQPTERILERRFGLLDRLARHRARRVDDEDLLARLRARDVRELRRQNHQQCVGRVADRLRQCGTRPAPRPSAVATRSRGRGPSARAARRCRARRARPVASARARG